MSPYPWTHVGTPSHPGHMDRVAATMPSQAHAGAPQEAPDIGQWEGQDVPLVRPSSCNVKGGILSSQRYLPTYLQGCQYFRDTHSLGVVGQHGEPLNLGADGQVGLVGAPLPLKGNQHIGEHGGLSHDLLDLLLQVLGLATLQE